jgi:hypothetical protein
MLAALAHHVLDDLRRYGRQLQIGQHTVERFGKVAQRIHHGAVEVDHDGIQFQGGGGSRQIQYTTINSIAACAFSILGLQPKTLKTFIPRLQ